MLDKLQKQLNDKLGTNFNKQDTNKIYKVLRDADPRKKVGSFFTKAALQGGAGAIALVGVFSFITLNILGALFYFVIAGGIYYVSDRYL